MNYTVQIDDNLTPAIEKLGRDFPRIENYIVSEIAKAFAEHEKETTLSGQVLGEQTGETKASTKFYKLKSGHFRVSPGAGVSGRLNYLPIFESGGEIKPRTKQVLKFDIGGQTIFARRVYIPPAPFVSIAFGSFAPGGEATRIAARILERVFKKRGLK